MIYASNKYSREGIDNDCKSVLKILSPIINRNTTMTILGNIAMEISRIVSDESAETNWDISLDEIEETIVFNYDHLMREITDLIKETRVSEIGEYLKHYILTKYEVEYHRNALESIASRALDDDILENITPELLGGYLGDNVETILKDVQMCVSNVYSISITTHNYDIKFLVKSYNKKRNLKTNTNQRLGCINTT